MKAAQTRGWVTGIHQRKRPGKAPDIWVLVLFESECERFFVLTNEEIVGLQKEENEKWLEGYRRRHDGREYDIATGVDNLPLKAVESAGCENAWDKIVAIVGASANETTDGAVEDVSG